MGATFPDIKENIRTAIGKSETPEAIIKTCFDTICLMKMIYNVDVRDIMNFIYKKEAKP